jgi:hypothetical protein
LVCAVEVELREVASAGRPQLSFFFFPGGTRWRHPRGEARSRQPVGGRVGLPLRRDL